MANVTTSTVILQPLSTLSGDYPSSTNGSAGFTTVTVNYGDNVIIPIRSGSTTGAAGTSNYGFSPNGTTQTGGTLSFPGTTYSSSNTTINATVSGVTTDGLVSFWCQPSNGGSSVGWRARVQVNVTLDTTISLNSTSISLTPGATSYANGLTGGGAGTIYYVFSVSNIANGSNLDALRTGGDSRYIARTFTTATSKPFSTDGVTATITNGLPSSGSSTFYIYAANLNGQNSQYLGYSYTVSAPAAQAPTVSATKAIIPNGFGLYSNPTGTTSGTVTYQWSTTGGGPNSKGSFSTGYTSNQNLGVGTEWVGTTWTCQARATTDGSTFVYSGTSSTTLPTYSVTAPTSIQEGQQGTFSNSSTNGLGPIYYQVTTASGGDFATSTGQIFTSTFGVTPTSDGITEGSETATVKLYINNTYDSLNYIYAEDTFLITDPPATPTAPVVSNTQTFAGTESATTTCTIALTSSGTNGTLEYNVTTSTTVPTSGWQTSATVSVTRGTSYYFWARRGVGYEDRTDSAIAVPYLPISDNTITIGIPTDKNGSQLSTNISGVYVIPNSYGTSAGDNILIPYSDGGSVDQYRVVSNDTQNRWLDTRNGTSGTFVLEMNSSGGSYSELPAAGQTWEYEFEGRRLPASGGDPSTADSVWVSVDGSQTRSLFREAATSYSVSRSAASINEGQSVTFTVTTVSVANGTTVGYTISGIVSNDISAGSLTGTLTISANTASTSITLDNDILTEGTETATFTLAATDSASNSTGSPSTSVTIADTSTQPGGGTSTDLPGGTANTYGLAIKNQAGTQTIIDDTSRIGSSLASGSITFTNSNTSGTLFSGFNCSSVATTGFILKWTGSAWTTPTITRSTNGITVTRTGAANGTITVYLIRY